MAKEKTYVGGIMTFPRNEKAPDFVEGALVITLDDLWAWAKANPSLLRDYKGKKQIRLQILKGRDKINMPLDDYNPQSGGQKESRPATLPEANKAEKTDDLPF